MMKDPIVSKKVAIPFILITSLFAMWGFANAVTDPMVTAFKKVLELNNFRASLVQMAFYGGYFTMALPASVFIRKYSYKAGILIGLGLYAIGALLFYPAAVTEKFAFFLIGLYVLTFGLAFLETTANPYIITMGSPETATRRLNLAQAFNPLGLILGLLIAQKFVLAKLQSDDLNYANLSASAKAIVRQEDLLVIRDPYVILGLVVIAIFVLIAISKMPEKKDQDTTKDTWHLIRSLCAMPRYLSGVLAQAANVAAQIMCWTYIYPYAEAMGVSASEAGNYQFMAFVIFFIGRFFCTFLLRFFSASVLLASLTSLGIFFTLGVIFADGMIGLYCLVMISFSLSLMFPTIYGISLEHLNEDELKIGAAGLVMAIVGGALMPTLQGLILDIGGPGYADSRILGVPEVNFSFVLPFCCFICILLFALFAQYNRTVIVQRD